MTKAELQRAMRAYLATLDPDCKYYMPDLVSTVDKSHNQNSYLWVLCQRMAEVLHSTKEEVYQDAVRKVGVFDFVLVTDKAVDTFITSWNNKGLGWFAEKTDMSKVNGATKVICYYGTSVYTKEQEDTLLSFIKDGCRDLGIEYMTDDDLKRMGVSQ